MQSLDLAREKTGKRAYDAGCNAFLRKPFNLSNMMEEIECFLGVRSPRETATRLIRAKFNTALFAGICNGCYVR